MLNKKEVIYNAKGLVSAWLNNKREKNKSITDLRFVCDGGTKSKIVPCNENNAGEVLGNILCENNEGYTTCKLLGTVGRDQKEFGIIDIN